MPAGGSLLRNVLEQQGWSQELEADASCAMNLGSSLLRGSEYGPSRLDDGRGDGDGRSLENRSNGITAAPAACLYL